jgi:murein DD-endopeptidase MepM/ murein hydrolase activator NlpD
VTALVAANRLASDRVVLRLGQRLVVPASGPSRPTTSSASPRRVAPADSARKPARASGSTQVAAVPRAGVSARPPARGPRGLELAVPDFVEVSPLFVWPVEGPITSTFGRRRSGWHRGIDIKAQPGAVVFAAAAGLVVTSAVEPRYGRVVKIEHDDGYVTVYAHNEENLVEAGMRVAPGDPIATIGRTGRATAHHLHFEIRRNGAVYNPLYLLPLPPRVAQVEEGDEPEEEHE